MKKEPAIAGSTSKLLLFWKAIGTDPFSQQGEQIILKNG